MRIQLTGTATEQAQQVRETIVAMEIVPVTVFTFSAGVFVSVENAIFGGELVGLMGLTFVTPKGSELTLADGKIELDNSDHENPTLEIHFC